MSYDPSLPTDRDHVRLLIGDRDPSAENFSDAELDALLSSEPTPSPAKRFLVAALALESLLASWIKGSNGLTEKEVDELRVKYGISSEAGVKDLISRYRKRGNELTLNKPTFFQVY